jgi:chemotaxis protein methyltransferase CheR
MHDSELHQLEIDLVLQAIYLRYGIDFRDYKRASILRNMKRMQSKYNFKSIADMVPVIMHDPSFLEKILETLSVPFTEFFRDPLIFKTMREQLIPILSTYPFIKIWHAGCATGEEIYSFAILLKEEGLYDRARIYATDINSNALK